MNTKVISSTVLLFFSITVFTPMSYSDSANLRPTHKVMRSPTRISYMWNRARLKWLNMANIKKTTMATCTALLASGTTVAVYTTKLMGTLPEPIFAMTNPLYRDRKVMHVFLAKALGKKMMEYWDIKFSNDEIVEAAINEPINLEEKLKDSIANWDEEAINRSIIFSKPTKTGSVSGFILLPGLVGQFEAHYISASQIEYTVNRIADDSILLRGILTIDPQSQQPL